jgi:hypothetical protein
VKHSFQAYWQHPNRRISSRHCARPLIGEAADMPSSRELGSPKRSSILIPSSMINGIIFCRITQVCFDRRINIAAWLHRIGPLNIRWALLLFGQDGIPETRMFEGNLTTTNSDIKSMQQFQISNMRDHRGTIDQIHRCYAVSAWTSRDQWISRMLSKIS